MPETSKPPSGSTPGMRPVTVAPVPLSALKACLRDLSGHNPEQRGSDDGGTGITGLAIDSRLVQPGDLYIGLPGARAHGAAFTEQALTAGAVAVLTDATGAQLVGECPRPLLISAGLRKVVGPLAAMIYQSQPKDTARPALFGVTGTNGKTTTTYLLNSLLRTLGMSTGLIGTIEILAGEEAIPSELTTPESPQVHGLLALMRERRLAAASMEVSSHAITYRRVDGVFFDVAGFTNLSQDHLDLHSSMEEYFQAKSALFTEGSAGRAVVSVDDEWGRRMAEETSIPVTTLAAAADSGADWTVAAVEPAWLGYAFVLRHRDGRVLRCSTGLPGSFNVANAALATVMVHESGVPLELLQRALDQDPFSVQVPGRMQLISSAPVSIVDFAHNPDALIRALEAVRPPEAASRLILVFGATGQRDAGKREAMGAIAARRADVVIVTDDDPHDEDPTAIRSAVLDGARQAQRAESLNCELHDIAPRAAAIERAVELAGAADTILLAGRGHEVWQEVEGINLPLDDRLELRRALEHHGFTPITVEKIES